MKKSTRLRAVATVAALTLAACGGGSDSEPADDETSDEETSDDEDSSDDDEDSSDDEDSGEAPADTDPPVTDPPVTEPPVTEPAATEPPATDAPVATEPPAGGDGSSIDQAAALVGAAVTANVDDVTWSIRFDGLAEGAAFDEDNSCVTLMGDATLDGGIDSAWNATFDQFDVGLIIGGERVSPTRSSCEEGPVELSDRISLGDLQVTTGTTASFGASFLLEGVTADDIEAVVLGEDDEDVVQTFFLPTIADSIPGSASSAGPTDALTVNPIDAGPIVASGIFDNYTMTVTGFVEIEATERTNERYGPGRCIGVTAVATLDSIDDSSGTNVKFAGFGGPSVVAVANGHVLDLTPSRCETDALTDAGYQLMDDIRPLPGTSIDTVSAVFVPDELDGDLLIGFGSRDEAQLFAPGSVAPVPALSAPVDATVLPASAGPFNAGPITWTAPFDTVWNIEGVGVVALEAEPGLECVAVLATVTADMEESFPPPFKVIADGEMVDGGIFCDDDPLVAAGWVPWIDFDAVPGTPVNVAVTIAVPEGWSSQLQGLIIGNAEVFGDHLVFDATTLDAIPPV